MCPLRWIYWIALSWPSQSVNRHIKDHLKTRRCILRARLNCCINPLSLRQETKLWMQLSKQSNLRPITILLLHKLSIRRPYRAKWISSAIYTVGRTVEKVRNKNNNKISLKAPELKIRLESSQLIQLSALWIIKTKKIEIIVSFQISYLMGSR